jgi:hypothetical protein
MAGPFRTTKYFDEEVRKRRPYLQDAWLMQALAHPEFTEIQPNGRIRHWLFIPELKRYIRVVTLEDGQTIHTAFPDRGFKAPQR